MKPIRYLLLTVFATIAIFSAIIYSACNKNKCHNVVCQNNGVCNSGICVCPVGFEGNLCQTLSRNKFLFTYNGYYLCGESSLRNQYSVHFLAVLHDSTEMVITNFLGNVYD